MSVESIDDDIEIVPINPLQVSQVNQNEQNPLDSSVQCVAKSALQNLKHPKNADSIFAFEASEYPLTNRVSISEKSDISTKELFPEKKPDQSIFSIADKNAPSSTEDSSSSGLENGLYPHLSKEEQKDLVKDLQEIDQEVSDLLEKERTRKKASYQKISTLMSNLMDKYLPVFHKLQMKKAVSNEKTKRKFHDTGKRKGEITKQGMWSAFVPAILGGMAGIAGIREMELTKTMLEAIVRPSDTFLNSWIQGEMGPIEATFQGELTKMQQAPNESSKEVVQEMQRTLQKTVQAEVENARVR